MFALLPNAYVAILMTNVIVLVSRNCGRFLHREGRTLMSEISALYRGSSEIRAPSTISGHHGKVPATDFQKRTLIVLAP